MVEIRRGRWTARMDEPYVVFIIGMRINNIWKVHQWVPTMRAMGRMLTELYKNPAHGFLGGKTWFARTTVLIQYWRSFEDLEAYAKARDLEHLPAWANFNRKVSSGGDVGVFHETYRIAPGQYENVFVNMPPTLISEVAPVSEANGPLAAARGRMNAEKA